MIIAVYGVVLALFSTSAIVVSLCFDIFNLVKKSNDDAKNNEDKNNDRKRKSLIFVLKTVMMVLVALVLLIPVNQFPVVYRITAVVGVLSITFPLLAGARLFCKDQIEKIPMLAIVLFACITLTVQACYLFGGKVGTELLSYNAGYLSPHLDGSLLTLFLVAALVGLFALCWGNFLVIITLLAGSIALAAGLYGNYWGAYCDFPTLVFTLLILLDRISHKCTKDVLE